MCSKQMARPPMQFILQPFMRKYSSKSNTIKKLMKEYKSVFGSLIETKSQKKRRLKLEKKGKIPQEKMNMVHTELSWVMKNSHSRLHKISYGAKPQADKQSNDKDNSLKKNSSEVESSVDANPKNFLHSESNQETTQEIKHNYNSTPNLPAKDSSNDDVASSSGLYGDVENARSALSNFKIIVKNLLSFSIMGNKQELLTQNPSTEILTISGKDDLETIKFPSVTKILTQTMSPESKLALEAWKKRMIEKLGEEGFEMHQKALLEDGTFFHSCIARSLLGKEYEVPPKIEPVFKSVQCVLKDVHDVKAIETYVAHTKLRYKGVVDCIASYRGENYVIDWKKSDKKKGDLRGTYDAPVQLAAYIGAVNASNLYPFLIKRGLLVIAYTCGSPATVHEVSDNTLQQYWTAWLRRLQKYHVEATSDSGDADIYTPIKD